MRKMKVQFTANELKAIKNWTCESLDYSGETLRELGVSVPEAMCVFDSWLEVSILLKLSPRKHAKIRKNVLSYLRRYYNKQLPERRPRMDDYLEPVKEV